MAIKMQHWLTTLPNNDEQGGTVSNPKTLTGAQTFNSREYGEYAGMAKGLLLLNITAATGSGQTLTVTLQGWDEAAGIWRDAATIAAQSAVAVVAPVIVDPLWYDIYRAQIVVAGTTPSFTFTLSMIGFCEEPVPSDY